MQITLKLYATLSKHLPSHAAKNTAAVDVDGDVTLNEVIDRFQVPRELAHLVMVNGVYQGEDAREERGRLAEGDTLAIWPPVAGG